MNKIPINHLRIAISYACNLKCQHCYVPELSRVEHEKFKDSELSVKELIDFINKLKDEYELKKISISGGEPLYRKVWDRTKVVLEHALDNDLEVQFNTNGCGDISGAELKKIVKDKTDLINIHISLDGINDTTVDKMRGQKGTLKKALKTIEEFTKEGFNVKVRYTVTKDNFDEIIDCYNTVSEIGVKSFLIKPIFPSGNAIENQSLLVDFDHYRELQLELARSSVNKNTICEFPQPVLFDIDELEDDQKKNVKVLKCNCGSHAFYLSFDGDVYPCTYLVGSKESEKYILGNIKDNKFDFDNNWNNTTKLYEYRDGKDKCPSYDILARKL